MLQAFLDDSGSEPSGSFFVLGGLIATVDRWTQMVPRWKACLRKDPSIDYFKATEANGMTGQFGAGWTRPLIDQRATELADIAAEHAMYRVHCVMPWEDFNAYIKGFGDALKAPFAISFRNPYMTLFFGVIFAVNKFKQRQDIDCECEFVFDEQGKVGQFTSEVYRSLRSSSELGSLLKTLPKFANDKRVVPLQAADLYVWNAHDFCVRNVPDERNLHIKKALFDLPAIEIWMDQRYLAPMRETLFEAARLAPQFLKKPVL